MSRQLKLVCCAVALTAGVGAALAATAPARRASRVIICPLEPNDTITTTCCGPPVVTAAASPAVFPCCGTPPPISCGLTLSSSSEPSTAGKPVTLTGRWPVGTAGQTVALWQKLPGSKTFSRVARTKTGSLGTFKFVRKGVETNRKWYVTLGSEHSFMIDQGVRAVVTAEPGGQGYHGQVMPNHAGEQVWVERRVGTNWTVIGRSRLSRASIYGFTSPTCISKGRVVFPGDRRNARSSSPELSVRCGRT